MNTKGIKQRLHDLALRETERANGCEAQPFPAASDLTERAFRELRHRCAAEALYNAASEWPDDKPEKDEPPVNASEHLPTAMLRSEALSMINQAALRLGRDDETEHGYLDELVEDLIVALLDVVAEGSAGKAEALLMDALGSWHKQHGQAKRSPIFQVFANSIRELSS